MDDWSKDLEGVTAAPADVNLEASIRIQRPIPPSIGPALLGAVEHLPDEVTQKPTFIETLLAELGQDARDLLRSTDQWAADREFSAKRGEAKPETFRRIAHMMINHYRRTLLVAKGARESLELVKAHPIFRATD